MEEKHIVYTTEDGIEIIVEQGKKSAYDFKVRYRQPNKHIRTPKHIHLIIDLYLKKSGDKEKTLELVKTFLRMIDKIVPSKHLPPSFQEFSREKFLDYKSLNQFGEYSVEFLAAIFDLIMIQEKTNYPNGTINRKLFEAFLNEKDIFSVISAATFR